jgi:predicted NBD/HSP70 family sugar kinase
VSAVLSRDVDVDGVVELLRSGDATTVRLVRDAGRVLGASLATAVSLLNPSNVVLSGQVAVAAGDHLLAGRHLDISISTLWPDSGIHGLARGIADVVLAEH